MTNAPQHHRLMKWSLSSTHLSYNNDSAKIQADEKKKKKNSGYSDFAMLTIGSLNLKHFRA
jgi:hypothetical protein